MHKKPYSYQQGVRLLILLLLAAIFLWILNIVNIVQGIWATMFNAMFTGLGTIFALLQCSVQTESSDPVKLPAPDHTDFHNALVQNIPNRRKGAIVVYTPRSWRGTTVHLLTGLQESASPGTPLEAISIVVEYSGVKQHRFQCLFPAVPPGHYTLVAPIKQRQTQLTVRSGHVSEIDWR